MKTLLMLLITHLLYELISSIVSPALVTNMLTHTGTHTPPVVGSSITHRGELVGACEISPDEVSHARGISVSQSQCSERLQFLH